MNKILIFFFLSLAFYGFVYYQHNRLNHEKPSSVLTLSGKIDSDFHYKVMVKYVATKDRFWCKSHAVVPFTYTKPSSKIFEYYPTIDNGKHNLRLPLTEYLPDKGCQYRPVSVLYSLAPLQYAPLFNNNLLIKPEHLANWVEKIHDIYHLDNTKIKMKSLNVTCYTTMQSALSINDPNKHWLCRSKSKKPITLTSHFDSNTNLEITLNIHTISNEEYKKSCFHWAAHNKEKCQ